MMAHDIAYKEDTVQVYARQQRNPKLSEVSFNVETDFRRVGIGWGKRPKWGEALGANTVNEFKPQIKRWLDICSKETARKISPSRMLRLLETMHSTRYDLPTEHQIQQVESTLKTEEKNNGRRQKRNGWKKRLVDRQGLIRV